jgi:hypothetical protein
MKRKPPGNYGSHFNPIISLKFYFMKWAKTINEYTQIFEKLKGVLSKGNLEKEMSYYDLIANPSTPQDLKEKGFGVWGEFKNIDKHYTKPRARARYELFIGGYLYYFDKHVKESGSVDRTLYFDWGKINNKAVLTIFLKPFYGNTLKTEKTNTNSDMNSNGNGNGKYNGFVNKQEEFDVLRNKPVVKMQKTAIAPPPALTDTDPPPPPPPPPPPRE